MKPGFLYVLGHPSDPNLHKIGVTVRDPKIRIKQHNKNFKTYAGRIVLETGQEWQVKTIIEVEDVYWAEAVFWNATPLADIPFLGGIEVAELEWNYIEKALRAAQQAGVRPAPKKKVWERTSDQKSRLSETI